MGRRGLLVVCLAGALVLCAVLSVSAQATKHINAGPLRFHATSGRSEMIIEAAAATPDLACSDSQAAGELTPTALLTIEYRGCGAGAQDCASVGSGLGVVRTNPLTGALGYLKAPDEVGLDLKPAEGEVMLGFGCPKPEKEVSLAGRVKGSVIGRVAPLNRMSTSFTVALEEVAGKQELERFEGGLSDTLEGEVSREEKPFEPGTARQIATETLSDDPQVVGKRTFRDPVMIKTGGATPVWGRCRRARNATYHDANCTMPESATDPDGKFEFFPIPS